MTLVKFSIEKNPSHQLQKRLINFIFKKDDLYFKAKLMCIFSIFHKIISNIILLSK